MTEEIQKTKQRIRFNGTNDQSLVGYIELPRSGARAWVLFAHCFTCSKDLRPVRILSDSLVQRGFGVLRFDFTGLGESEGDFADTTFSSNLDDLVAAADFLRLEYEAPAVLVGHSLGGAAVLAAAERIPESLAVVTIGAPSDPRHLENGVLREVDPESEETEVLLGGRPFIIKKTLLEDLKGQHLLEKVGNLKRALLLMHSPVDELVGIDHARLIYQAAKHPKSFVSLDNADHLLLDNPEDAHYAAEILGCWVNRYLPKVETAPEAERPAEGIVEVTGGASGFKQRVRTHQHDLVTDEPLSVGGTDLGPNPYDLLLASLGSCISMTLRMYADLKKIPLEGVRVRLRHQKIHARDCEECETESGKIDRIEKQLDLIGDQLSEEQLERLGEISERCPVHRTLTSETTVVRVDAV